MIGSCVFGPLDHVRRPYSALRSLSTMNFEARVWLALVLHQWHNRRKDFDDRPFFHHAARYRRHPPGAAACRK